jgi:hypothetical protein
VALRVVVEATPKRAFASAIDWPGWARSGRTADEAIASLLAYAPRYTAVAKRARIAFSPPDLHDVETVERLSGGGSTEFGVPGEAARAEAEEVSGAELKRLIALLRAAWATFDRAAGAAANVTLATGPRGGGRSLAKMRDHVRDAELAYLGQLGSRPPGDRDDLGAIRDAFLKTLTARVRDEPLANPRNTKEPWAPRYAVRRSAWHSLDHAWELEDRSA